MTEMMTAFLVSYYHMSSDTAHELIAEGLDTRSLQRLTGYRAPTGGAASTPPKIFTVERL